MKWFLLILAFAGSLFAQTTNNNILPASTGLNLGASNQRWNGFFQNVDIAGNCTLAGQPCLSAILNLSSPGPIGNITPGIGAFTGLNSNGEYSPTFFGAKCDGVSDDTAAFNSAIAAANSAGGVLLVPASISGCFLASTLTISVNSMILEGVGWSYGAQEAPSSLKFAAGVNGILFSGNAITVRDLAVISADSGANSDIGIHFTGGRPFAEHVLVQGFGGPGFEWDSTGAKNVDHWYAADLRSLSNFGDGFLFVGGTDTNAGTAVNLDASLNGGIGFNLSTSGVNTNTFIGTVAATNTGGGYNIAGSTSSNYFLNAYCESGTGSSFTIGASSSFNQVIFPNFGLCTTITNNGGQSNQIYYQYGSEPGTSQLFLNPPAGTAAGSGQTYELSSGIFNPKDFDLRDVTGTKDLLDYNHSLLGGSWHFLNQAYFTNFAGATSGGSTNSGISGWFASCWNGSTAQNDYFTSQVIGGTGTNGTEALSFIHHPGCSGATSYSFDSPVSATQFNGAIGSTTPAAGSFTGLTASTVSTTTNCANNASPAVCSAAPAGAVALPTGVGSTTLQVNTTAVTANSRISLQSDDSLTIPSTTCNSTLATLVGGLAVTARSPGVSFTISYNGTVATNPLCVSYLIVN